MKLQKKRLLSLVLIGVLFVLPSAQIVAYDLNAYKEWIEHSAEILFSSKLSRYFLPIAVLTGIAALFTFRWYKKRNIGQSQPVDQEAANGAGEEQNNRLTSPEDAEQVVDDVEEEQSQSVDQGAANGVGKEQHGMVSKDQLISSIIGKIVGQVVDDVEDECDRVKQFVTMVVEDDGEEEQKGVMFGERVGKGYLTSGRIRCGVVESVPGVKCSLFNGIVVQQFAVLHQDTEEQIDGQFVPVGGGSASCGYHAIKNALMLLTQDSDTEELLNSTDIARHFCAMPNDHIIGCWRKKIINEREEDNDGEWLDERKIRNIIQNNNLFKEGYLVIENVDALAVLTDDVEAAKDAIRQNSTYVFFVNTGGEFENRDGQVSGRDGHWFTMVLKKKDGKSIYTVVDSKNIVRLHNNPWVKKVIEKFENGERVTDELVLSRKSLGIMENGIEQFLENRSGGVRDEKSRMKLQELTSCYQSWGDEKLPFVLQDQIDKYMSDDEVNGYCFDNEK